MSALWELASRAPSDIAVDDTTHSLTWGELDERTNRFGHALESLAPPGSHVAIVAGNRLEFLEAVIGAWRAGYVNTPLKSSWTAREIDQVLEDAGTKVVVTDRDAARAAAAERGIAVIDFDAGYESLLAGASAAPLPADRCGWRMSYTSGTTGRPKGVVRAGVETTPFPAAWAASTGYAEMLQLPREGVHLFGSRLFNGAPLTFGLAALAHGARLRIMPRWDAVEALALLGDPEVTSTVMVPTMFRQLLALPDVDRSRPAAPGLRTLLHGGEPCPAPVKRAILDWFGPVLIEYYGFTEGAMTFADSAAWLARPGTVGKPMAGLDVCVVDDHGSVLPPRTEGTVAFVPAEGERRFRYLNDDGKTDAAHVGGAFTVRDVGWVDEDGYLYISGRAADVVITAGMNVYPAEIEDALADVPGVADLCAVGAPDEERGEVVALFVTLLPGADEPSVRAALDAAAADRLARYKRPATTLVVNEIPRDPTGKLLRAPLRDSLR